MGLELDIKKHLNDDDLELFDTILKSDFEDFSISIDINTFIACCDDIVISNNLKYIQATLCCTPRQVVCIKSHKLPILISGMRGINDFERNENKQWKLIPDVLNIDGIRTSISMLFIRESSILTRENNTDTLEEYIKTKYHTFTIAMENYWKYRRAT